MRHELLDFSAICFYHLSPAISTVSGLLFSLFRGKCASHALLAGNDLARSFGWGPGFSRSMLKPKFLEKVKKAKTSKLDRCVCVCCCVDINRCSWDWYFFQMRRKRGRQSRFVAPCAMDVSCVFIIVWPKV